MFSIILTKSICCWLPFNVWNGLKAGKKSLSPQFFALKNKVGMML